MPVDDDDVFLNLFNLLVDTKIGVKNGEEDTDATGHIFLWLLMLFSTFEGLGHSEREKALVAKVFHKTVLNMMAIVAVTEMIYSEGERKFFLANWLFFRRRFAPEQRFLDALEGKL